MLRPRRQANGRTFSLRRHLALSINQREPSAAGFRAAVFVQNVQADGNGGVLGRDFRISDEDPAACRQPCLHRVGDVQTVGDAQTHISIQAAVPGEVQVFVRLAGRHLLVIPVVQADREDVFARAQIVRQIHAEGQVTAVMHRRRTPINPDLGNRHGGPELHRDFFACPRRRRREALAIPANPLPHPGGDKRLNMGRVRERHGFPRRVVKSRC